MVLSLVCLFLVPFLDTSKRSWIEAKFLVNVSFALIVLDVVFLGWLGGKAASPVFMLFNQVLTFYYFFHFFVVIPALSYFENNAITKWLYNEA